MGGQSDFSSLSGGSKKPGGSGPLETVVLLGQCGRQAGLDLEGTVRKTLDIVIRGGWVIEPVLNLSQKRD